MHVLPEGSCIRVMFTPSFPFTDTITRVKGSFYNDTHRSIQGPLFKTTKQDELQNLNSFLLQNQQQ